MLHETAVGHRLSVISKCRAGVALRDIIFLAYDQRLTTDCDFDQPIPPGNCLKDFNLEFAKIPLLICPDLVSDQISPQPSPLPLR